MQKLKWIRLFAILCLLSLIATGCVVHPPHHGSVSYRVSSGYDEPWGYYYYPDSQVYFHYSSGFYYYPSGSVWVRTRFLPRHFHLNSRGRVRLHIENKRPYVLHHQHREKYRPNPKRVIKREYDRKEREHNRDRYERRHRSVEEQRFAPKVHCPDPKGRVHKMKPEGVLCAKPTPKPRHEREKRKAKQPPIRFDSPPQHRPIPMAPEETRDKAKTRQRHEEPRRKKEKTSQGKRHKSERQGKKTKGQAKQKSSRQQKHVEEQYEEQREQEGQDKRRSKKDRREDDRDKRYR